VSGTIITVVDQLQSKPRQVPESNLLLLPPSLAAKSKSQSLMLLTRHCQAKTRHMTSKTSRELLLIVQSKKIIQEITTITTREIAIRRTEMITTKKVETRSGIIRRRVKKRIKTKNPIGSDIIKMWSPTKIKINRPKMRLKVKNATMSIMMRKVKPMIKGLTTRMTIVEARAANKRRTTRSMFRKILTILRMAVRHIKGRPTTTMQKLLRRRPCE
jgi:hypothetical protein